MSINNIRKLCIIGPLPPPIHGLSLINKFMLDRIKNAGISTIIFNSKSASLNRNPFYIILRFLKMVVIIIAYLYLVSTRKINKLYISLSGGFGQVYELLIIFISRLFKIEVTIHHHSFAYLNKENLLTKLLVNVSVQSTTHIVLCEHMGNLLKNYNSDIYTRSISNSAFLPIQSIQFDSRLNNNIKIGFLSNISFEKGIYEFIEVFKNLSKGSKIQGIIAGPFSDVKSQDYVENQLKLLKNVKYIGSIAGKEKHNFFTDIDILLFPTNYKNEAEPVVIHEALSYGIPVIARSKGCIYQIINSKSGIIIDEKEDYISSTVKKINNWNKNREELFALKKLALDQFKIQKNNSLEMLNRLIKDLAE